MMTQRTALSMGLALMLALSGSVLGQNIPAGGWAGNATLGTAAVGDATGEGGVFTVTGNGSDIQGTADHGQFLYKEMVGDGAMWCRVTSNGTGTNAWCKGGIMVRQTTDAGSMTALMPMTGGNGNGSSWQWRLTNGGGTSYTNSGSVVAIPYYVKIERVGDSFSGWYSPDGITWTQLGASQTIAMSETCLIGLAVTSHTDGELRTYTFDNLGFSGGVSGLGNPGNASGPLPESETDDVLRDSTLSWAPGAYPGTHNVYFGTSFADVNSATVATASGLTDASFDPGRLEFGQTYYWRVDEVNASADRTVFTGNIWHFTVEPYAIQIPVDIDHVTASSSALLNPPELTVNGSGLTGATHATTGETMWLSAAADFSPWLMFEFNGTEKLHQMLIWNSNSTSEGFIGWGIKDVSIEYSVDGVEWTALAESTRIDRAPGLPTYKTPQAIDFGLVQAKYVRLDIQSNWGGLLPQYGVAEVQFYALPVQVREPMPADGAVDVRPDALVAWRAGREAGQHAVYVSEDMNAVADGSAPSLTSMTNSADLKSLDLQMSQTYYWRVDEVNDAEVPPVWAGPVWSLNTADRLIVDDFESYTNFSPNRPFQTWIDGFGFTLPEPGNPGNGTGAGIGHDIWSPSSPHFEGSIMETVSTIAGSTQSMPFYYTNSGGVASETQRTFSVPQDWTVGQAMTLSIPFQGQTGNTGTLYVKINGVKMVYPHAASNIALGGWQAFNIDLASVNTNLTSITKLAIGVDGSSASGMILIDDITLHAAVGQVVTPVDPGSNGLVAHYSFEGNANDVSGNGNNGTLNGGTAFSPGVVGTALDCDGIDGYMSTTKTASNLGIGGNNPRTISSWVFTKDFADGGIYDVGARATGEDFSLRTLGSVDNQWRVQYWGGDFDFTFDTAEKWVHFTHVHDGVTTKIYANGLLIVDWAKTINTTDTNPFQIGLYGWPGNFFYGLIDEVRVYNRALSAGEALSLAGGTAPIDKPF